MTDLFISYNSHDEAWAKKLFFDLRIRFPTIKLFWARDTAAIPPGEPFRPVFQGAAQDAAHFVVFWSAAAQRSNEVGPEIQSFLQNRQTHPMSAAGDKRTLFYVSLEPGIDYGGLVDIQGFPDFRGVYNPNDDPDRGIAGLAAGPASQNWRRMIGSIGNTVLASQTTQPITVALLVMTKATTGLVDPFLDLSLGGPTLNQFLQSVDLTLDQAKARYGDTAFSWQPFGTNRTVIDLMEDVREMANAKLPAAYRFHWRPTDFVESVTNAAEASGRAGLQRLVESLSDGPSVVVTDPISLFNPLVKQVFNYLGEYAKRQQSVILSISPNEQKTVERLYGSLLGNVSPALDGHLYPPIPAAETFALCGMNIQHAVEVERFIRCGLGYYYLQKKKIETKPLLSSGV
jgi:hypothetical protein